MVQTKGRLMVASKKVPLHSIHDFLCQASYFRIPDGPVGLSKVSKQRTILPQPVNLAHRENATTHIPYLSVVSVVLNSL